MALKGEAQRRHRRGVGRGGGETTARTGGGVPTAGTAACASFTAEGAGGGGDGASGRVVVRSNDSCTQAGVVFPGIACGGSCACSSEAPCFGGLCCSPLTCGELQSRRP